MADDMKKGNPKYGRLVIASVFLPYLYACGVKRGYLWKGLAFYVIYKSFNALYDIGMYLRFIVYGGSYLRKILALKEDESFGNI